MRLQPRGLQAILNVYMAVNLNRLLMRLEANKHVVSALVVGVKEDQAHWKPDEASWSLVEVICHLYDEEREDFRMRVDLTLHHPDTPWPPIHPTDWVTSRGYNQRNLDGPLAAWSNERDQSLAFLRGLVNPDWHASRPRPWGGTMSAGDLLAAWLAHDFLHIRQINALHYQYHLLQSKPLDVTYAGEW